MAIKNILSQLRNIGGYLATSEDIKDEYKNISLKNSLLKLDGLFFHGTVENPGVINDSKFSNQTASSIILYCINKNRFYITNTTPEEFANNTIGPFYTKWDNSLAYNQSDDYSSICRTDKSFYNLGIGGNYTKGIYCYDSTENKLKLIPKTDVANVLKYYTDIINSDTILDSLLFNDGMVVAKTGSMPTNGNNALVSNSVIISLGYNVTSEFYGYGVQLAHSIKNNELYSRIKNGSAWGSWNTIGNVQNSIEIADGSITTEKIADDAVTAPKIASNSINSSHLTEEIIKLCSMLKYGTAIIKSTDDSDALSEYGDSEGVLCSFAEAGVIDAIEGPSIVLALITSDNVGAQLAIALNENKIVHRYRDGIDGWSTWEEIGATGEGTFEIADGSITTAKIADDAVTADKIADDSITSSKIANGTITENELNATLLNKINSSSSGNITLDGKNKIVETDSNGNLTTNPYWNVDNLISGIETMISQSTTKFNFLNTTVIYNEEDLNEFFTNDSSESTSGIRLAKVGRDAVKAFDGSDMVVMDIKWNRGYGMQIAYDTLNETKILARICNNYKWYDWEDIHSNKQYKIRPVYDVITSSNNSAIKTIRNRMYDADTDTDVDTSEGFVVIWSSHALLHPMEDGSSNEESVIFKRSFFLVSKKDWDDFRKDYTKDPVLFTYWGLGHWYNNYKFYSEATIPYYSEARTDCLFLCEKKDVLLRYSSTAGGNDDEGNPISAIVKVSETVYTE